MSFAASTASSAHADVSVGVGLNEAPTTPPHRSVMNFFRRAPSRAEASLSNEANSISAHSNTKGANLGGTNSQNKWALFWYYSVYPGDDRKLLFSKILNHILWRTFLILLTFILLFGAQVRDLLIPKDGDSICDDVFMATFVVFMVDILMRIDCKPAYFKCSCRSQKDVTGVHGAWFNNIQIGSFLFWCDFLSTMTLLTEIEYINKRGFISASFTITLDQFGVPLNGLDEINQASPVEPDLSLLVTICKTARVARFIRSNVALKISSKVNWFWLLNLINPCWYFRCFVQIIHTICDSCFMGRNENRGTRRPSGLDEFTISTAKTDYQPHRRRSTWGGLGLGALAVIRENEASSFDDETGFKYWPIRVARFFGLAPANDSLWKRHLAAIKIQRAWKHYKGADVLQLSERDAWRPRQRGTNAIEKALIKRSIEQKSYFGKSTLERKALPGPSIKHIARGRSGKESRRESQVGTAMRELTGQRVAMGIIIGLLLIVLFTYTEIDATRPATMIVLHNQTSFSTFANLSIEAARRSAIPDLYSYQLANGQIQTYSISEASDPDETLRAREKMIVTIEGSDGSRTIGKFAMKDETEEAALVELLSTVCILIVWFFGVTAFAGPVMVLVVIPIERMVRLLGMLMLDPLGYENSQDYKNFIKEEDQITKNTRWTKDVLKGMETSFLMSTILRIGSLMKVGFGSAGVEIIRNNLEKGQNKNHLALNSQGSSVSCIFLFCDIRQFTDATECLQEEVFVFTNKIAAVVHSICTAYGGSANKNIGDAFLLSWLLNEAEPDHSLAGDGKALTALNNQADKALLSVVKICMALHYDDFYISTMSETARTALLTKLGKRTGPVVQMGFGLHAGKAVQGAIGSQRKIDATYISDHVEQAEFLESSTKKYGVNMLMSDSFHRLLHPSNRRRCRKVDQLLLLEDDDDYADDYFDDASARLIELFTFDVDIDALWRSPKKKGQRYDGESDSETGSQRGSSSRRDLMRISAGGKLKGPRRRSVMMIKDTASEDASEVLGVSGTGHGDKGDLEHVGPSELVLPTGPAIYNANVWVNEDMRKIRERYSDGLFFQKYSSGLQAYYSKDWDFAKQCFQQILDRFEDGPSRYFVNQMEVHGGVPPKGFKEYGTA